MADSNDERVSGDDLLRLTVDVSAAYISNNSISNAQVSDVIQSVFTTLVTLNKGSLQPSGAPQKPAVPIRRSIQPDYLVCLEDGKKLKMLKRHLRTNFGMTPDEYRIKWNLPVEYPMVAPNYAKQRSEFAKKIGLGHSRRAKKKSS